jgi:DNA polymerase I
MNVPETQFDESLSETTVPAEDAVGGFTEETEMMTTRGPVYVSELTTQDVVYALDPTTRLVKTKPVRAIEQCTTDELVEIRTRRSSIGVAPDHPIVYRTKAIVRPRFTRAGDLDEREHYQFINQWRRPPLPSRVEVDITDLTDEFQACVTRSVHGHTFRASLPDGCEPVYRSRNVGYCFDAEAFKRFQSELEALGDSVAVRAKRHHTPRPYRFDADPFVRFIGWFVSEGSIHRYPTHGSAEIQIAQEKPQHRRTISALFDALEIDVSVDDRSFSFGSRLYGQLLEQLCGLRSADRRLPEFVWNLSTRQKQLLLGALLDGDGNECGTYYTTSEELAGDVLQLCLELGIKPRYSFGRGTWQVYVNAVNDGFVTSKNVRRASYTVPVYRVTVEDYAAVMGGRNGRFQWIGCSRTI